MRVSASSVSASDVPITFRVPLPPSLEVSQQMLDALRAALNDLDEYSPSRNAVIDAIAKAVAP